MDNANTLTIAAARNLGASHFPKFGKPQSFIADACNSEIRTADLLEAFNIGYQAAQQDAATAELAASGLFDDMPSVIAWRARQ